MLVTFKTIKQEAFKIEIGADETVSAVLFLPLHNSHSCADWRREGEAAEGERLCAGSDQINLLGQGAQRRYENVRCQLRGEEILRCHGTGSKGACGA